MSARSHATLARLALASFALGLGACGGSAPTASTASAPVEEPEPTTVEQAEEQIRQARARLEPSAKALSVDTQVASEAAPAAPQGAPAPAPAPGPRSESQECRALHSLERATKALCRLTSDDDPRCKDATVALEQDRSRIHCP